MVAHLVEQIPNVLDHLVLVFAQVKQFDYLRDKVLFGDGEAQIKAIESIELHEHGRRFLLVDFHVVENARKLQGEPSYETPEARVADAQMLGLLLEHKHSIGRDPLVERSQSAHIALVVELADLEIPPYLGDLLDLQASNVDGVVDELQGLGTHLHLQVESNDHETGLERDELGGLVAIVGAYDVLVALGELVDRSD